MLPNSNSPLSAGADTAPLDESEINRLIAAARNETYRPSETTARAPVETFRPKSLMELARLRREADKAALPQETVSGADLGATNTATALISESDRFAPTAVSAADAQGLAPALTSAAPKPGQATTVLDAGDLSAGLNESRPREAVRIPEPEQSPAATMGKAALRVDSPQPTDAAALERVRSEAYAAGRAEAEAEARAGLSAATKVLEAAAQALLAPAADVIAGLRAEITEAVLQIASERAGLEIDAVPSAFVERIEVLADRIHSRATQPVLRLHPGDLAAIEALIAGSDSLAAMRIVASEALSRGDVDLTVEGLRLSDRILGQPAARKSARSAAKPIAGN